MRTILLGAILLAGCSKGVETTTTPVEQKQIEIQATSNPDVYQPPKIYFAHNFSIISDEGTILGTGEIRFPFRLEDPGKGMTPWECKLRDDANTTNTNWHLARRRFSNGDGKAVSESKSGELTIDFSPEYADNNVIVPVSLTNRTGTVYFQSFGGRRRCAIFQIAGDRE